jgi:protocatechuate 3,4-dioxygenase beta subunit
MLRSAALLCAALLFAQAQPPAPPQTKGTGLLAGRIVDASGTPIPSAIVTLGGRAPQPAGRPEQGPRVLTDADGRYFFSDLAAGGYTISATKPGFIPGRFGARRPGGSAVTIDLANGERRGDLDCTLWRFAVISGRALDDTGDPMVDLDVRAFQRTFVAGRAQLAFAQRAKTDDRGVFRFSTLLPGDYVIAAPATVTSEPAGFAGTIRAEGQTPRAYLQTMTATGAAPMTSYDRADVPAAPGRLVSSSLRLPGAPQGDGTWRTYPTTYYPSATALSAATAVRAESGRERSGVDLTLRLVSTYQVSGQLLAPDGPAPYHAIHLLAADAADAPIVDVSTAVTDATGAFTFFGVPPGSYVARVVRVPWPAGGAELGMAGGTGAIPYMTTILRGPPPAGPLPPSTDRLMFGDQPVVVADRHVRQVTISLRAGARVSGRVEFDGSATRPTAAQLQTAVVRLEPAAGIPTQAGSPVAQDFMSFSGLTAEGQFTTAAVPAGRYLVRPTIPNGWNLKSATYQGRDISEAPLDLTADVDGVVIAFTDRVSKIEGTVQGLDPKSSAGATVLLFPTDASAWVDYGRTSRRVRTVATSLTGAFTIPAPPDGDYFLVAIPDEDAADWQNPAVLRKISAIADRIQVRDAQPVARNLQLRRVQ